MWPAYLVEDRETRYEKKQLKLKQMVEAQKKSNAEYRQSLIDKATKILEADGKDPKILLKDSRIFNVVPSVGSKKQQK